MVSKASYIDARELKQLSRLQSWRTAAAILLDWTVIVLAIVASEWTDSWLVYLAALPVIAGRQHGLAGLIHDFAHYRFVSNKAVNDWTGDILLAWPLLATVDTYRRNHLEHHRYTNTGQDPDWVIKLGTREFTFPQDMRFAILNFLGYFVGVSSIRDMRMALRRIRAEDPHSTGYKLLRFGFYGAVVSAVTVFGVWPQFLLYWLAPYFTLFFFFLYIRSVAEHFGETMEHSSALNGTRTVLPHVWERWFFCPHNLNYHLEHHIYPSVPFYRLPELNKAMMAHAGYAAGAHITRGYTTGLFREVWADGWRRVRAMRGVAPAE